MHKILNKEKIIIPKTNILKQRYDAQDMNQTFINYYDITPLFC